MNPSLLLLSFLCALLFSCGKTTVCINYDNVNPGVICTGYNPVCGCDDITYPNECEAQKNGVVSWIGGVCP